MFALLRLLILAACAVFHHHQFPAAASIYCEKASAWRLTRLAHQNVQR